MAGTMVNTTENTTESITGIMEMDHQTNQNSKDEPKETIERKRHGSVGFAVASVALLLVIVGLVIFIGMKLSEGKAEEETTKLAVDASFEVAENSPKEVADQISSLQESTEEEIIDLGITIISVTDPTPEPEDLPVDEKGYDGESLEADLKREADETDGTSEEVQESTAEETEESKSVSNKSEESGETQASEAKKESTETVATSTDPETRVIDFNMLQTKKNGHIYAWINVPGTNIDYPVLRHPTDDGFYLYHNLNGSQGYPGCIYTENWNSKDWTDPVTVLYGHDMRSTGTMFHQLHKFESQSFFDKHEYFYIYTPEKTLKYQIFSAYVHSNEHLLGNHNFSDKDTFDSFFGTVLSTNVGNSHARAGVTVTSDSKVVALSTCIKNKPENRYIIFGVLVN
ncbi:MAG: sortase [Lachnospiraceae bacterium]|nr:sortase [Lachnospiraceae bacterium]